MAQATLSIDLDAVVANRQALDAVSGAHVETAAVVKADAYGLGAAKVAKALQKSGARTFFVAVAEEGIAVRKSIGPTARIFVFAGHMKGDADILKQFDLIPLLNSTDQILRQRQTLPGHGFGIQLDTGMNRLGMEPAEWAALAEIILPQNPTLVMSHLACADEPDHPMNARQLARFHELTDG
ncbi:MAG: alanine racemase, partial [Paracoccaceae bacterium]|nr:alanine racemase [Paracoccaceae bacterium]